MALDGRFERWLSTVLFVRELFCLSAAGADRHLSAAAALLWDLRCWFWGVRVVVDCWLEWVRLPLAAALDGCRETPLAPEFGNPT